VTALHLPRSEPRPKAHYGLSKNEGEIEKPPRVRKPLGGSTWALSGSAISSLAPQDSVDDPLGDDARFNFPIAAWIPGVKGNLSMLALLPSRRYADGWRRPTEAVGAHRAWRSSSGGSQTNLVLELALIREKP
jgi:hypothetical protein